MKICERSPLRQSTSTLQPTLVGVPKKQLFPSRSLANILGTSAEWHNKQDIAGGDRHIFKYVSLQERTQSCFDLEHQSANVVPKIAGDLGPGHVTW